MTHDALVGSSTKALASAHRLAALPCAHRVVLSPFIVQTLSFERVPAALATLAIAVKCASDVILLRRLRGTWLDGHDAVWIVVKDWLVLAVWCAGAFARTVSWRGHAFRIGKGSVLSALPAPSVRRGWLRVPDASMSPAPARSR